MKIWPCLGECSAGEEQYRRKKADVGDVGDVGVTLV